MAESTSLLMKRTSNRTRGSNPLGGILGNVYYIPSIRVHLASLVQLVERRSPKPDVVGSSPTGRERKASYKVLSDHPHLGTLQVER